MSKLNPQVGDTFYLQSIDYKLTVTEKTDNLIFWRSMSQRGAGRGFTEKELWRKVIKDYEELRGEL